jgi:hypothetical protein
MSKVKLSAKQCAIRDIKTSYNNEGITDIALDFDMFGASCEIHIFMEE